MSEPRPTPYPYRMDEDEAWIVHVDGKDFSVSSEEEAKLIASLPVEHWKTFPETPEEPDRQTVEKMVEVCKTRGVSSKCYRYLRKWLQQNKDRR